MAREAYKKMNNKVIMDSKISISLLNDDTIVKQEGIFLFKHS